MEKGHAKAESVIFKMYLLKERGGTPRHAFQLHRDVLVGVFHTFRVLVTSVLLLERPENPIRMCVGLWV